VSSRGIIFSPERKIFAQRVMHLKSAGPMPKILMLTTDQVIDRRILLEAEALTADGWDVVTLAMPGSGAQHPNVVRVAASRSTKILQKEWAILSLYRFARRLVSMNGKWVGRLRSALWRHWISPDEFAKRIMLPDALRYPADVVVAHDLPILPTALQAASHHGAKLVYDSHELYCEQEFEPRLQRMWSAVETRSIGACDAVITVNPSIARELMTRYGLARVEVVENAERADGPPPAKGRLFHQAFGLDAAAVIILFQGGLIAGRNLETLVEAMPLVTTPAMHLVFLGDGALARKLSRHAEIRRVKDRVHFHPAVAQNDLLRYTASADLGIIPYQPTCLNNLYCTPNKLFEYIAAGVPMLATDLPELRRLIAGNDIGLMIDTASPAAIARALNGVTADRAEMERLRSNVKEARTRLNWAQESKTLVDIFRRLKPA
jgi:glycosyltransferase involved in cell wall biosynthesis